MEWSQGFQPWLLRHRGLLCLGTTVVFMIINVIKKTLCYELFYAFDIRSISFISSGFYSCVEFTCCMRDVAYDGCMRYSLTLCSLVLHVSVGCLDWLVYCNVEWPSTNTSDERDFFSHFIFTNFVFLYDTFNHFSTTPFWQTQLFTP